MKPRLEPERWTVEDTDIWVKVLERSGLYWYATCLQWFQGQDRRDAELVHGWVHLRAWLRDWEDKVDWVNCPTCRALGWPLLPGTTTVGEADVSKGEPTCHT